MNKIKFKKYIEYDEITGESCGIFETITNDNYKMAFLLNRELIINEYIDVNIVLYMSYLIKINNQYSDLHIERQKKMSKSFECKKFNKIIEIIKNKNKDIEKDYNSFETDFEIRTKKWEENYLKNFQKNLPAGLFNVKIINKIENDNRWDGCCYWVKSDLFMSPIILDLEEEITLHKDDIVEVEGYLTIDNENIDIYPYAPWGWGATII